MSECLVMHKDDECHDVTVTSYQTEWKRAVGNNQ